MAAPTNLFFIIDDYTNTSTTLGGGSGAQLSPEFTTPSGASSLANAQWVAQQFATLFQRSVRLVQKYNIAAAPYTPSFVPNTTSLALSNAPSGVSY